MQATITTPQNTLRASYSQLPLRFAEGLSVSDKSVYVMHVTPVGRRDAKDAEVAEP